MGTKQFNQFKDTMKLQFNNYTGNYQYVSDKVSMNLKNICVFDGLAEFETSRNLTDKQYYELCEVLVNDFDADVVELEYSQEKEMQEEINHRQCIVYGY